MAEARKAKKAQDAKQQTRRSERPTGGASEDTSAEAVAAPAEAEDADGGAAAPDRNGAEQLLARLRGDSVES